MNHRLSQQFPESETVTDIPTHTHRSVIFDDLNCPILGALSEDPSQLINVALNIPGLKHPNSEVVFRAWLVESNCTLPQFSTSKQQSPGG